MEPQVKRCTALPTWFKPVTTPEAQPTQAGPDPGDLDPGTLKTLRAGVRIMAAQALGDASAAEEVAQEALTRTVAALREGRVRAGPEKLGSFVRGIARHVIADFHRARERDERARRATDWPSPGLNPLDVLLATEQRERVREALAELQPSDRQLLRLCFFEGLSPAEAALRLGEPGPRIRKRKSRALARLRVALLGEEASRSAGPHDSEEEEDVP